MYNRVVLVRAFNGLFRFIHASECSIDDGYLVGFIAPQALSWDNLAEIYKVLPQNKDFEIEPLDYSGVSFSDAYEVARQTHPGGWEKPDNYDGYIYYNGVYPFMVEGKWYSIYFYSTDILEG